MSGPTMAETIRQMLADWDAATPEQREAALRAAADGLADDPETAPYCADCQKPVEEVDEDGLCDYCAACERESYHVHE